MPSSMDDVQTSRAGVPQAKRKKKNASTEFFESKGHPLDSEESKQRLDKLMQWRRQARGGTGAGA